MLATLIEPAIDYPDSDGLPMADNTHQCRWIFNIKNNLDCIFEPIPDVFVAADHLIYPVKGDNKQRIAPDSYVAFGRPKGDRGSYKVWEEGGIFPQVVFEVWSPSNSADHLTQKKALYERYGAEEYYLIHPELADETEGYTKAGSRLIRIPDLNGWVSPRLGIRFELKDDEWHLYRPDGSPFQSPMQMEAYGKEQAARADREQNRADVLAARLRELGIDPDTIAKPGEN